MMMVVHGSKNENIINVFMMFQDDVHNLEETGEMFSMPGSLGET